MSETPGQRNFGDYGVLYADGYKNPSGKVMDKPWVGCFQ